MADELYDRTADSREHGRMADELYGRMADEL